MNIFVLDVCPMAAAVALCDKHLNKMQIESAQMLSTAHRIIDGETEFTSGLYKATHTNHPCSKWVRESADNYQWLWEHFVAMGAEWAFRYNKLHKTFLTLGDPLKRIPNGIDDKGLTPFALAMPETIRLPGVNAIDAYRAYYHSKQSIMQMAWTNRERPEWLKTSDNQS